MPESRKHFRFDENTTRNGQVHLAPQVYEARHLPSHNREAEHAVLGTMLRDHTVIPIPPIISPADMYVYGHRLIYLAIKTPCTHNREIPGAFWPLAKTIGRFEVELSFCDEIEF
jgi:hypothetical protein